MPGPVGTCWHRRPSDVPLKGSQRTVARRKNRYLSSGGGEASTGGNSYLSPNSIRDTGPHTISNSESFKLPISRDKERRRGLCGRSMAILQPPLAEAASKGFLSIRKDWLSFSLPTAQDFLAMAPPCPGLGAFYNLRCADGTSASDTGRIISSNPFCSI